MTSHREKKEYEVKYDQPLGVGTWSNVHLAENTLTKKIVACKTVKKNTREKIRLAKNEIYFLEQAHHPNIIKLYGVVDHDDRIELYLEYYPEGNLYELCITYENECLPVNIAKPIARQLLNGLQYLHANDVIHRDIKAENVLLRAKNVYTTSPDDALPTYDVVLCDMGLSRHLSDWDVDASEWVGNPMHASPELANHIPYRKGPDVWAFGVLLYNLITGDTPFKVLKDENERPDIHMLDVFSPANYDHPRLEEGLITLLRKIFVVKERDRCTVNEVVADEWWM